MASYNINQREPLLDSNLSALVQKRGRELVGLCLVGLAMLFAVMLGSYTPDDPGWMAASDEPVRNSLGRVGGHSGRAFDGDPWLGKLGPGAVHGGVGSAACAGARA